MVGVWGGVPAGCREVPANTTPSCTYIYICIMYMYTHVGDVVVRGGVEVFRRCGVECQLGGVELCRRSVVEAFQLGGVCGCWVYSCFASGRALRGAGGVVSSLPAGSFRVVPSGSCSVPTYLGSCHLTGYPYM